MKRLPRTSGTPYESGTVTARAAYSLYRNAVVVEVTLGNQTFETVAPLTLKAALEMRDALDAAIRDANQARAGCAQGFPPVKHSHI